MSIRGIWLKVRSLLAPGRVERELEEELRFHLDLETEANLRRGMSPHEARRTAHLRFGGVERFREQAREVRGTGWIVDLVRDARLGLRSLSRGRSRGFTAAVLLTLALGVGGTTAVFSVVRSVLLRPLPFPEAGRLVSVWLHNPVQGIDKDIASYPDFASWRADSRTLERLAAVRTGRMNLTGEGEPEEVIAAQVSRGFFEMMGVAPALGRAFQPEEAEEDGASRVAVLSHELWTRRYGADPGSIGGTVLIDDVAYEVVGIAPPGQGYPREAELWVPLTFAGRASLREARGTLWLPVVGRMAPGVSLAEAQADMSDVAARLAEAYPESNEGLGILLEPLHETLVGSARAPLALLLGAVLLVLLIAAANIANLVLVRGHTREGEMAVRLALGAGKGRLARQVLAESAVLGIAGGLLGAGLAWAGVGGLLRLAPAELARMDGVAVDAPVLAFAVAVALATSLLFGVAPALQAGRGGTANDLHAGGRGSTDGGLRRLRGAFVAAQLALALVLLVGSGLLARSFVNLLAVDPGFEPRGVLGFRIGLPPARYPDYAAGRAFYDELIPALESLPGVEGAAAVSNVFLARLPEMAGVSIESRPELDTREHPVVYDGATPAFLSVLGMRLVAGRGFGAQDERGGPPVAIVSEGFVSAFLPGRDPIGERFLFGTPSGEAPPWITVVGVVADARRWGVGEPLRPYAFLPMNQFLDTRADIVVRTSGDPAALADAVRGVMGRLDRALPITNLRTLEQAVSLSLAPQRFLTLLLLAFAASATALAAVGIYGVTAYVVARRTREIGIRVALGAQRTAVLAQVLRQAAGQIGGGVAAGLLGALALTRFLDSQLFGLQRHDPATFLAVSVLLVGVALFATWVPARRAAGIDPSVALREE